MICVCISWIPPVQTCRVCVCIGVSWAIMVGLAGGSVLVPLYYVPSSQAGLVFLPSFGAGAMLTSPVLFGLSCLRTGEIPAFHIQSAMLAGIFSGM